MNIIKYPERNSWSDIVRRPHLDVSQLNATVSGVLNLSEAILKAVSVALGFAIVLLAGG